MMSGFCSSHLQCAETRMELFSKNGYPIFECVKCHDRFIDIPDPKHHLSEVYSDGYFFEGKAGYPNYLKEKDLLIRSGKRYAGIIGKYMQPGKMLDIGCAAGFIMKGFEESGWECSGVEPNETMSEYGRFKLKLDISTGSLEDYTSGKTFDLITMIQVIGHFYDLDKALMNVSQLLRPGGLVLIESWNMKSLYARLMGKHWHEYSPPSVVHWFSDETLTQAMKRFGLQIIGSGHPDKRINLKHAFSLLNETTPRIPFKQPLLNITSRLMGNLTLRYPFDDLKWYIYQKA